MCYVKIKSIHHQRFRIRISFTTGLWRVYKISVINDGIHKIDYDFLSSIGVNVESLNPNHIHIYGNGDGMLPESNSVPRTDDLAQNVIQRETASKFFDEGITLF